MGDKRQTHVFRHEHIFCQICLKSCEGRYLKREKFEKILDTEKLCNYTSEWEKKNHQFNTFKNQVLWELIKNGTNLGHRSKTFFNIFFLGTLFKNDYIDKKISTTYIQNDKKEKIHTKITNTPDAKISVKRQSAGINYRYGSSWKKKDLIQCIICDEQKHKKGHPIALAQKTL